MAPNPEPVVRTSRGDVRGAREGKLSIFLGIPFAEPPVGAARFAAPRTPQRWDGVREATAFGPPPPQDTGLAGRNSSPMYAAGGDNWLTLNVWTPDIDHSVGRPVMLWVHGGGYRLGSASDPGYDARRIAEEGDVVVVTFNYRIGIEGFALIDGAPPNRGLLDQVAALQWIAENISRFGGDPGNVTIFGESAGAGAIAALLAMPRASGLFRRAIVQGMPGLYFSNALARDIASTIAAQLGVLPTVGELAAIGPHELVSAGAKVAADQQKYKHRWGAIASGVYPLIYAPVVDGDILPETPWTALSAGRGRDVALIIGHNRDEFRLFMAFAGQLGTIGWEEADAALRTFGPGVEPGSAYRAAFPEASAERLYERVQSDWLFRMPAMALAQAQLAGGGNVHVYELTWPAPGSGGGLGACHGLDGPLVFGTLDARLGPFLLGPEPPPEAFALSSQMRIAWTAFAATGHPGWPRFDTSGQLVQVFDVPSGVMPYPEQASRGIWKDHHFAEFTLRDA